MASGIRRVDTLPVCHGLFAVPLTALGAPLGLVSQELQIPGAHGVIMVARPPLLGLLTAGGLHNRSVFSRGAGDCKSGVGRVVSFWGL